MRKLCGAILAMVVVLCTACASQVAPSGQPETGASEEKVFFVYNYECPDGYRFVARIDQSEKATAVLELPDRDGTIELTPQMAASGEKYVGQGIIFWSKGDEAFLELDGTEHVECRRLSDDAS